MVTEAQAERSRAYGRRELARALGTVCRGARDEDDFVLLWGAVSGHPEQWCRRLYREMAVIDTWDIDRIISYISSNYKDNNNIFSVNNFIDIVPHDYYHLAGKAIVRIRGRLEPAGWEAARHPSRKGSAVRTWRFRDHKE